MIDLLAVDIAAILQRLEHGDHSMSLKLSWLNVEINERVAPVYVRLHAVTW